MFTSLCRVCGKEFRWYPSKTPGRVRLYCSKECSYEGREGHDPEKYRTVKCKACGKSFSYFVSAFPDRQYCSQKCYDSTRPGKVKGTCQKCGKEFWYYASDQRKGIYCSRKCEPGRPKTRIEVTCEICGTKFTRNPFELSKVKHVFCSLKCFGKYCKEHKTGVHNPKVAGPLNHRWKGGKIDYRGPNWQSQRSRARKRDKYTCQKCGTTEEQIGMQLDVHHVIPFREFGLDEYKKANALSNLLTVCHSCHRDLEPF